MDPYFNWMSAYRMTVEAYMSGSPRHVAIQEWPREVRKYGLLLEQGGQNGVDKADNTWHQIPKRVSDAIVLDWKTRSFETRSFFGRVSDQLIAHIRSERQRLNVPRDYGIIDRMLGIRKG